MSSCKKLTVFPQVTGTCWFNSILMSTLFSENVKEVLRANESKWQMSLKLKKIFKDILTRRSKEYEIKKYAFLFFKVITPEHILELLHKEDPVRFNFNPNERVGYFSDLYLPRLLTFLGVDKVLHLDAKEGSIGGITSLYFSNIYNNYKLETVIKTGDKKHRYKKLYVPQFINKQIEEYDIITIRYTEEQYSIANMIVPVFNLDKPEIKIGKSTYVFDSLLLTNFNISECRRGHDIAGITCGNQRYMYNGWMRRTQDASKVDKGGQNKYPCELMPYDWLKENNDFCLNPALCKLDPSKANDIKQNLCFNATKGPRTYILVNKKFISGQKPHAPVVVPVVPPKTCPEGKIVNPATGRCVKIDGKIGKKLLQKS